MCECVLADSGIYETVCWWKVFALMWGSETLICKEKERSRIMDGRPQRFFRYYEDG